MSRSLYLFPRFGITTPDKGGDATVLPRLPGRDFISSKSPSFSTNVQKSATGREVTASYYSSPIWKFKISYEFLRDLPPLYSELQKLFAFFCNALGKGNVFNYFDPADNVVTNSPFGIGNGVQTLFQLTRQVGAGTIYAYLEPVYVINGRPNLTVNGATVQNYTIGQFGQVTFSTPPANGAVLNWSGSFMFRCRFDQDEMSPEEMVTNIWDLTDGITFVSKKP